MANIINTSIKYTSLTPKTGGVSVYSEKNSGAKKGESVTS